MLIMVLYQPFTYASASSANPYVVAGIRHTVGLKSDGLVLATGLNQQGQCNVGSWRDIVQVAAGTYHTVGLKLDGTVLAVGSSFLGKLNVNSWTDITQANAGVYNTLGLRSDGRVVAVGYNDNGETNVFDWEMISPHAITKTTFLPLKDQYMRK